MKVFALTICSISTFLKGKPKELKIIQIYFTCRWFTHKYPRRETSILYIIYKTKTMKCVIIIILYMISQGMKLALVMINQI